MDDLSVKVSCENADLLNWHLNRLKESLSLENRRKVNTVFSGCLVKYGLRGAFARMNGRSLQDLINTEMENLTPLVESELDGQRFRLFEAPPGTESDD